VVKLSNGKLKTESKGKRKEDRGRKKERKSEIRSQKSASSSYKLTARREDSPPQRSADKRSEAYVLPQTSSKAILPPGPLPARRAYRPEGRPYGPEANLMPLCAES